MDPIVAERIRNENAAHDVVLYMKGTPVFPQCGFSAQAVQILNILGVKFKAIDVLMDPSLRQGIKDYSEWPTVPQIFIKGEFIGNSDILREMLETGELQKLLSENGISYDAQLLRA
ncbi:MAG: Grx4 family monothiol glutaredoxin [Pseudomonadota bacterium]|nr:Grx4 family monothiol glutaredoxin [Pseudomonadota bacterium]